MKQRTAKGVRNRLGKAVRWIYLTTKWRAHLLKNECGDPWFGCPTCAHYSSRACRSGNLALRERARWLKWPEFS